MPNPGKYKDKQKWMEDCMHQTKTVEGKPQDQAVAICLSKWRNKGKDKDASFITSYIDKVAGSLEKKNLIKEAMELDIISNTIEDIFYI